MSSPFDPGFADLDSFDVGRVTTLSASQADQNCSGAALVAVHASVSTGQAGNQTRGRWYSTTWWSSTWWAAHWWALSLEPGTFVAVSGVLSEAQAADLIAVAAGVSSVTATAALAQVADFLVASGEAASVSPITGGLSATQADQSLSGAGQAAVVALVAGDQSPDQLNASVTTGAPAFVAASVEVTQDDQGLSATVVAARAQQVQQSGGIFRMRSRLKPRPIKGSVQARQDSHRIAVRGTVRDVPKSHATVIARSSGDTAGVYASAAIQARTQCQAAGDCCRATVHLDWHDLIAAEDEALLVFGPEGMLFQEAA